MNANNNSIRFDNQLNSYLVSSCSIGFYVITITISTHMYSYLSFLSAIIITTIAINFTDKGVGKSTNFIANSTLFDYYKREKNGKIKRNISGIQEWKLMILHHTGLTSKDKEK